MQSLGLEKEIWTAKIGHVGTLDHGYWSASSLYREATKFSRFLIEETKHMWPSWFLANYGHLRRGWANNKKKSIKGITHHSVERALSGCGNILQKPPMFSAKKLKEGGLQAR